MTNIFLRRDLLLNEKEIEKISKARIALFGLGGVGGYVLESLARMGINHFFLCDGDVFDETNLNRQLLSNLSNIGFSKVEAGKDRILSINKDAEIAIFGEYVCNDNIDKINFDFDYIIDCIDDSKAKVLLIKRAKEKGVKIISAMGAGNRLSANFIVSDIYKTEYDPLSKKMRSLLKKEGIDCLKVVYTKNLPLRKNDESSPTGSISYVVGMMGLKISEEVIKDLLGD